MTTLALAPAGVALEAALAGGWTVTAGPRFYEYTPGELVELLPADVFTRGEQYLVVTYAPSGRPIHATLTAGDRRESEAGPAVLDYVLDTLNR